MRILTKWLTVPETNRTREIEVAQLWEVRWTSRHGTFHADQRPEVEAFPTREAAEEFAEAIKNAFALLRFKNGDGVTRVTVEQAR